jgi:predicted ATPase
LKDDYEVEINRQISVEKGQGELIAHFLHHYATEVNVLPALQNPNRKFTDLLNQTTAWEREISSDVNVKVNFLGRGYELKYSFEVNGQDELPTNDFRAENVGFGLTYSLPIIVSILAAQPGSLICIENPESHLHPHGQAKLVELICLAAKAGIQLIIETHSDHIINGICVATKRGIIGHEHVKVWHLELDGSNHATKAHEVPILPGGRIKQAPDGFFDQFGKDLRTLMSR